MTGIILTFPTSPFPHLLTLSFPLPFPFPSLLAILALDPGLKATLFAQLSSSWELVQLNTQMPAAQSSFVTQLFLIYDLHLATALSYQF